MATITIDEEFKNLLPPLSEETFNLLEENILQNGCRDSLVTWEGTLIDGYNRYEICTKHGLPFNTIEKEFETREEAKVWIILNQISRRNLTTMELSNYRGIHYRTDKIMVRNSGGKNQYLQGGEVFRQNDGKPKSTATRLSELHNVSPRTIERDARISESIEAISRISPVAARMILSGKTKIDKQVLERLLPMPNEELEALAKAIEEGEYTKEKPENPAQTGGSGGPDRDPGQYPPQPGNPAPERPTAAGIRRMTDDFYNQIETLTSGGAATGAINALRAFIDRLENLYGKLRTAPPPPPA